MGGRVGLLGDPQGSLRKERRVAGRGSGPAVRSAVAEPET